MDAETRYVLALEIDDFVFLVEPASLRKPPRVLVRRRNATARVWLDEDDVSLLGPSTFTPSEERRVLSMVRENLEALLDAWFNFREDQRRGRLERNPLVD